MEVDFSIPRHFLIIRQMIATRHVINDMTLSFPCRMFALFSLQVLLNGTMFERLRNAFVLPWRCDDETYSIDIKDGFKWKASYGEDEETMNAHFDFWYRQIFLNPMVEFRYTDVYGVAGFAKIVGPLYSFTHQLHGFLEYVDEATFHRLQELRHWSLFSYYDSDVVKHYCILWGTTCLLNHNDWAAGRLNVLNNELDAMESGFKLSMVTVLLSLMSFLCRWSGSTMHFLLERWRSMMIYMHELTYRIEIIMGIVFICM